MNRRDKQLVLAPGKARSIERRHPWIYDGAIGRVIGDPAPGETVAVHRHDGRLLGWAFYSPASAIRARLWSSDPDERIDARFFERRLADAIAARAWLASRSNALRLVFGEADGLPGLIVDRYDNCVVVQFSSVGAEFWREPIIAALLELLQPRLLYERSDGSAREREGLPASEGPLAGEPPGDGTVEVVEDGLRYSVDFVRGHKTGFYIDQRDNRRLARQLIEARAGRRRVLNCFCYTGGFSIAALAGGAAEVVSVDSSQPALDIARRQLLLNRLPADAAPLVCADVFEHLNRLALEGERFDLIVLDPPKFAQTQAQVERAARAYKQINMKALALLAEGGCLMTFSCSGAIGVELFQKIIAGAVIDAGVDVQMLARLGAGADHPTAMTHPQGEYLKGLLLGGRR